MDVAGEKAEIREAQCKADILRNQVHYFSLYSTLH
jgi:hypothetical protein